MTAGAERIVAAIDEAEEIGDVERPTRYSDDAIAALFTEQHGDGLKFVPEWGWLEWEGQRWRLVSDVVPMQRARLVCRSVARVCAADSSITPQLRERLARNIASAKTAAAVEKLARGDARHLCTTVEWDQDPWLLNTPGGTVELRTGTLRAHRRGDRITKITKGTPRGRSSRWSRFLDRVTGGDTHLQAYLQRLAGYCLAGDPSEECVDFFYGSGGNGKGTFIDALQHTLGDYAVTANIETFTETKGDRHPTDIAKLAGARLVVASEVDEGRRWDEARLKSLTGRDVLSARKMRKDFFDFRPEFTLIIAGNHKPALKSVDEAIRRRIHMVPFLVTILEAERDPDLKEALRAEADEILAWAVEGCLAWQKSGLTPPKAVLDATRDYLEEEDVLGLWLRDCCVVLTEVDELSGLLYESHRLWREARGESCPGQKKFSSALLDRGFRRTRDAAARKIAGLRLIDTEKSAALSALQERRMRQARRNDA